MQRAFVNYHFPSPERQAYHIDAGGETGKMLSPPHDVREVALQDERETNRSLSFRSDSLEFLAHPNDISISDKTTDWHEGYGARLRALLMHRLGAAEVIIFDHTIRSDDPRSGRKPARNVHSDYSQDGAHKRLRDLVGEEAASEWENGHFGFRQCLATYSRPDRKRSAWFCFTSLCLSRRLAHHRSRLP